MRREFAVLGAALMMASCSQQGASKQPLGNPNRVSPATLSHPPDTTGWPIFDRSGRRVGRVVTTIQKQGVSVFVDTAGLPPGIHGVHLHEVPDCKAPTFASAGAHWNWRHKKHGHNNPSGYHAGDLGNLSVGADRRGQATFNIAAKDWDPKLAGGLPVVIHAKADDDRTDPAGNSGERIACGVLYLRHE